jgi:hypothetical protein
MFDKRCKAADRLFDRQAVNRRNMTQTVALHREATSQEETNDEREQG